MVSKLDDYFGLNQAVLNLRAQRQELIASNIANADTPNYKARDIHFNRALQLAMQRAAPAVATPGPAADSRHLPVAGAEALGDSLRLQQYRSTVQGAIDGNTVDMDVERNQFADNALRYEAVAMMTGSDAKTMLAALQGG